MKNTSQKLSRYSAALVFFLSLLLVSVPRVSADELLNRSITLSSSFINENVTHTFQFDTQTASNIGSIEFLYCSNSPLFTEPCVAPAGLDVSGAGLLSESGMTGFTVSGITTNNSLVLTRATAFAPPSTNDYIFDAIINPSVADVSYYVRITTNDDADLSGAIVDQGAVVFVTEDFFDIQLFVPPYLTFCTGVTVALDCSTTTGFLADFGEFSSTNPTTATSQMSAATNDPTGYNIFISGQTMTSGANIIPNLTSQTLSQPGISQFGLNLRSNALPSVGSNTEGPGSGAPATTYNNPNRYRFVSGDRVAGSSITTSYTRYTVSYIVNVSEAQNPGVYAATLTYTAIASF